MLLSLSASEIRVSTMEDEGNFLLCNNKGNKDNRLSWLLKALATKLTPVCNLQFSHDNLRPFEKPEINSGRRIEIFIRSGQLIYPSFYGSVHHPPVQYLALDRDHI